MIDTDYSLYSAFLLTGLLLVGLFFFVKASIKDRTETLVLPASPELADQITQYLRHRGYTLKERSTSSNTITWSGRVRPSLWLMLFLSSLAGIGTACLGLVLSILLPQLWTNWVEGIVVISAVAGTGIFYWRGANRTETVRLIAQDEAKLQIQAHRDELATLTKNLHL